MPDYCTSQHTSDCQPAQQSHQQRQDYGSNAARQEQLRGSSGSITQNRFGATAAIMGNFAPVNIFDALYTVQSIEGTVVDIRNGKQPSPSDAYSVLMGFKKHFSKIERLRDQLEDAVSKMVPIDEGLEGFLLGERYLTQRDRRIVKSRVQRAQQQLDWLRQNLPLIERVALAIETFEQNLRAFLTIPIFQSLLASVWLDLNMSWVPVTRSLASAGNQLHQLSVETLLNGKAMLSRH